MKLSTTLPMLAVACVLAPGVRAQAAGETNAPAPATARDWYNAGTELLAAKKFDAAEKMFAAALATQDPQVQPAALYNVGHTRFSDGFERLTHGPDAQKTGARGDTALAGGAAALQSGEAALAGNDMNKMMAAYLEGHGARHDLRDAQKAVSEAMDTYGKTLDEWLKAAHDFKGAAELNPTDTNATQNAKIVERGIAKLVDIIAKMQKMSGAMGRQRQDLGKMLSKLKGQIPGLNAPPGGSGGDEDDEDVTPASLAGQKENTGHEGTETPPSLSPDQATQILNGMGLDGTRRLSMSDKEGQPAKDRNGRNW